MNMLLNTNQTSFLVVMSRSKTGIRNPVAHSSRKPKMYNAKKSDWLVSGNYVHCVSIQFDLLI